MTNITSMYSLLQDMSGGVLLHHSSIANSSNITLATDQSGNKCILRSFKAFIKEPQTSHGQRNPWSASNEGNWRENDANQWLQSCYDVKFRYFVRRSCLSRKHTALFPEVVKVVSFSRFQRIKFRGPPY